MNNHTKGPWRFKQEGYFEYIGSIEPAGIWFGGRSSIENTEHLANISLVLSAPDLLEALEDIVNSLVDADEEGLIEHTNQIEKARNAISKAKRTS